MSPLIAFVVLIVALVAGFFAGRASRKAAGGAIAEATPPGPVVPIAAPPVAAGHAPAATTPPEPEGGIAERTRIIRSYEDEAARLRRDIRTGDAARVQLADFADERRRLFGDLARSRAETARYRQLVIDLEDNAPSTLFGPGAPDDLKLIVGIGPVLERMLHQLGVTTFRQVAFWSESDIDEFDGKLHEFPGRIRRDEWVTQARSLHQSKYGEPPARP